MRPRTQHLLALAGYLVLALLLFGRDAIAHPDSVCACWGDGDPTSFMWSLEWWPHALSNGLNPFLPDVIWAPEGANLTQGGFAIPAAALVLWPATALAGPVVSYNVASLAMPVLAAWFTYRLCRYLTGQFASAFMGGLVFGFGTYMTTHLLGHLNLTSVFLAPVAVQLVLQRLDDAISQRRFVVAMALVFALQFLLGIEILLIGLGVGAFALLLGYLVSTRDRRARIAQVALPILAAGGIAMVLVSPYLYWLLDGLGDADSEAWKTFTGLYPGDALNPVLPTAVTGFGHWWFEGTTSKFTNSTIAESAAYVGPVLIAIVAIFAVTRRRRPATRVLVAVIVLCYLLSLGTKLHVAGDATDIPLPWALLHPLPVLDHVIPTRFWAFALLAIAIVVALWLAEPSSARALKWATAVVGVALMIPNLGAEYWKGRPTNPAFFTTDAYKRHIAADEVVLALPYARYGSSMLWQAQTGMHFKMVEGYVSPEFPPDYRSDPFFGALLGAELGKGSERGLRDFLVRRGVDAVVVERGSSPAFEGAFEALDLKPLRTGGVLLYRVPPAWRS